MIRRLLACAVSASVLLSAVSVDAQQSVIVRKPDNSGPADLASGANQTATQAAPGSDASKAQAVQGVTGGKPIPVSDATEGTTADAAYNGTGSATIDALLKGIYAASTGSIPAGSNAIGSVSVSSVVANGSANPTVSTSAYASGYALGGLLSFTAQPSSGSVPNVAAVFNTGSFAGSLDIYWFSANPSSSTTTDHANVVIAAADYGKLIGVTHLTDCTPLNGGSAVVVQCQAPNPGPSYNLGAGTTLYGVPVVRATPTFTASTDVNFYVTTVK